MQPQIRSIWEGGECHNITDHLFAKFTLKHIKVMRNRFFLITIFFCFVSCLFASNPKEAKTRFYRHELSIGLWGGNHTGWIEDNSDVMESLFQQVLGCDHFDVYRETTMGPQSENMLAIVNYFYHINHHIAVGILGGRQSVSDKLSYSTYDYDSRQEKFHETIGDFEEGWSSWFLMPSVKWTWLNNHWCSLYSKVTG